MACIASNRAVSLHSSLIYKPFTAHTRLNFVVYQYNKELCCIIMDCAACCSKIDAEEEHLRCAIDTCSKMYHFLCAGGRSLTESRNSWICPECRCSAKKGGDNSSTPVGSAKKQFRDTNVTHRRKVGSPCPADDSCVVETSELSTDEVLGMRQEMRSLKGQLSHAVSVIISYESQMATYTSEVRELNKKLASLVEVTAVPPTPETSANPQVDVTLAPVNSFPAQRNSNISMAMEISVLSKTQAQSHLEVPVTDVAGPVIQTVDHQKMATSMKTLDLPTSPMPKRRKQKRLRNKNVLEKRSETLTSTSSGKSCEIISETTARDEPSSVINLNQPISTSEQWVEVARRRSHRPPSMCGTAGPAKTTLKAVEPRKYMHLWNMESNVDDIRDYLGQLCPTGTCTVQELTPRGDYKSYKIGVPTAAYDLCFSTEVWPINARLKAWIPYQKPAAANSDSSRLTKVPINSNQPFRGASKAFQDR